MFRGCIYLVFRGFLALLDFELALVGRDLRPGMTMSDSACDTVLFGACDAVLVGAAVPKGMNCFLMRAAGSTMSDAS